MKNLLLGALCIVVMSAAGFGGYTYYENQKQEQMDPWIKANLAALADLEGLNNNEDPENSWWDIFNNYKDPGNWISVNTVVTNDWKVTYDGVTLEASNSWTYTSARVVICRDGGKSDACYSNSVEYM